MTAITSYKQIDGKNITFPQMQEKRFMVKTAIRSK